MCVYEHARERKRVMSRDSVCVCVCVCVVCVCGVYVFAVKRSGADIIRKMVSVAKLAGTNPNTAWHMRCKSHL